MRANTSLRPGTGTVMPNVRRFSPRTMIIAVTLVTALIAFEIFNFDTTKYALHSLLGDVNFAGYSWAAILAFAFCAIDFAGLARIFTPEKGGDEPREVWYLMGAWLLGATMNAVMTWWAVSLTLLNHEFGNEVLSRAQLLHGVPIFVAVLVWLTRILFIGALSVAGDHLLEFGAAEAAGAQRRAQAEAARIRPSSQPSSRRPQQPAPVATQPVPRRSGSNGTPRRPTARRPMPGAVARTSAPTTQAMRMQGRDQ